MPCMTATPVYTSKAAIIVGAIMALGAGIAVGATLVADLIDANNLKEYRQNPKIVSSVTLNDDPVGNKAGWNPGINSVQYKDGGSTITRDTDRAEFNIKDDAVTEKS